MRLRGCVNVIEGCQRISGGVSRKLLTNIRSHTIGFLYYLMAVLVAISIPIFTTQLEKSREATDISNIRSAYAEVIAAGLVDTATGHSATVSFKQQVDGWATDNATEIAGVPLSSITASANGSTEVVWHPASGTQDAYVTINNASAKMNNGVS